MTEFLKLVSPTDALAVLNSHLQTLVDIENLAATDVLDRVAGADIRSPENLPSFSRSTMDGYAVRAMDTYGASEGLPAYLKVIGEMPMGHPSTLTVHRGEAVKVHTGGMVADGADSVIMVENTQLADESTIEITKPLAPGENILNIGDDIKQNEVLFPGGHLLRPQDIGALMALGITSIPVFKRPVVAIISAGDEVIPPDRKPAPGQVRDINTYTISSLVRQAGGIPRSYGLIKDDEPALHKTAQIALRETDTLVISSGSSVSTRDITARVIASLGSPGVLVHGVSLRPGKPTILAVIDRKPVFGLPGNPVSAMVVFDLFVRPSIYRIGGCLSPPHPSTISAQLAKNIASTTGREDYVPVILEFREGTPFATPVFGESNLITTLVRAHGLVKVPLDKHGLNTGETVSVRLF